MIDIFEARKPKNASVLAEFDEEILYCDESLLTNRCQEVCRNLSPGQAYLAHESFRVGRSTVISHKAVHILGLERSGRKHPAYDAWTLASIQWQERGEKDRAT